jgi:hypothetical protein
VTPNGPSAVVFGLDDLPTALRYVGEHIDDAIKVVVVVPASHHAEVPFLLNQFGG